MKCSLLLLIALLAASPAFTQTRLSPLFSDHMVLQQNEKCTIRGTDSPSKKINVTGSWGATANTRTNKQGTWSLSLETPSAGGPFTITVNGSRKIVLSDVLIGEVWFCSGQSNMEMPVKGFVNQPVNGSNEHILNSENNRIRMFSAERNASLEPLSDAAGEWKSAAPGTTGEFSATAYFFGKKLHSLLNVPIGLIHSSWGGSRAEAWMDAETLAAFPSVTIPAEIPKEQVQQAPALLFNAMIHPFIGYTIKGVIWYQGESNRHLAEEYKSLFPALINSWRDHWKQGDFPFYFVQIAPYRYEDNDGTGSVFMREAQLFTMQNVKNTGMAVTMDIGDCDFIHPAEKQLAGDRLAYWALANDYSVPGIAFSGPVYREMKITDDSSIILSFDHAERGLTFFGEEPAGFEIAGEDSLFHPARVKINLNKTLTVWSESVPKPVAVRYAFKNCIKGTLFNQQGLPASSFRTDDWK